MTDETNAKVVLQVSVTRDEKSPYSMRLRFDVKPENKRELMNAMAFLAERSDIATRYLLKNIFVEELR